MKRSLEGSDSLGAFMSASVHDFPSMIDEEEGCHVADTAVGEKKRRLSVEQVKALEKNFELENKLEPERKVKLAQELGLQPRQVAIWFQNRRARWKTKQLERDYSVLKSNYDALKRNHDALKRDNDSLLQQIKELRTKLNIEETERRHNNIFSVKKEDEEPPPPPGTVDDVTDIIHRAPVMFSEDVEFEMFDIFPRPDSFKERPADSSDSSAVLSEECHSPTAAAMTLGCFSNFLKMDEHGDLFTGEEACKLFADDEHWYCSDQWNS